jgi:2,3-bisphosphoglycerate-independent phosphoglycerate mutase
MVPVQGPPNRISTSSLKTCSRLIVKTAPKEASAPLHGSRCRRRAEEGLENHSLKILFLFLDGIGLGEDNPDKNPFSRSSMPVLESILQGHKITIQDHLAGMDHDGFLLDTKWASLFPLDACLGIDGLPQSATGQAALMTGINVPGWLGFHEGPKPTPPIVDLIKKGTVISQLNAQNRSTTLINAFPARYFQTIGSGYRIPGVIALSTQLARIPLKTEADLYNGEAISADFTAEGWRSHLGYLDAPVLTFHQAGERISKLAVNHDLTIFEYWLTDIAGHHQDMDSAISLLEAFDQVLGGVINSWDHANGLILLTSDHGNMEDLTTRRHTRNDVPLLLIGKEALRRKFIHLMKLSQQSRLRFDLTDIAPAMLNFLGSPDFSK